MANKTTLGTWLKWLETPLQTNLSREKTHMIDQANKIRRMFYDLYNEYEVEVDVEECFQVQNFGHCGETCDKDTAGITLPSYMNNVEAAWVQGQPLSLYSKWREYKVGVKTSPDCRRAVYDMPGRYATERDLLPAGALACVQLLAKDQADAGKKVKVIYKSSEGTKAEYVELPRTGYRKLSFMASRILEVVLPTDLKGTVVIAQAGEELRILSEYSPYEHVPSYRRIKITGLCGDEVVVVRASRQYTDVFSDDDIVETDNRMAVEHAARYLFYSESGTGTDLLTKAAFHLEMMKDALRGMSSRDSGVNKEGAFLSGPPARRAMLWSQRRSHRHTFNRR